MGLSRDAVLWQNARLSGGGVRIWQRLTVVIFVAAALLWVAQPAPLYRDPPRQLPWKLPDYRDSKRYWHIDANGLIQARVEHFFLADISPSMVAWFYRVLPVSTVVIMSSIVVANL